MKPKRTAGSPGLLDRVRLHCLAKLKTAMPEVVYAQVDIA
jgi:hypothetical protein